MELRPNAVVNLGIGIPEGIASVAAEEARSGRVYHSDRRAGGYRGNAYGGKDFGSAINGDAILEQPDPSTSTTAAGWTRRSWEWRRPTHKATSTSAGSGPGSPDRVGSSTSARTRKRWLSWAPFWRRAERRSSTGELPSATTGLPQPKFLAQC